MTVTRSVGGLVALVLAAAGATGLRAATVDELAKRADALVAQMTLEEKIGQLMNNAPEIARLGIPAYNYWSEGLHGVGRNGRATMFPMPIGLSCSFDPELVREIADAIATEGRVKHAASMRLGAGWRWCTGLSFWSPNINIFRDPRWGRGMETWGEDPFLTGKMGAAFVRGLQGDDPVYYKACACAKHFAVHSGPEALRHTFDARPPRKDLEETYLPAFEAAVREGGVEAVMSVYNRVYGESGTASKLLLKDILRDRWGFRGHVVSDCGAVCDIWRGHKIVKTPPEAAALAIRNGLTFECGPCFKHLGKAIEQGLVTERELDRELARLLLMRLRLGILGRDADCPYNDVDPKLLCCDRHRALNRRAARESMVLLKNNGVLPLDPKSGKGYGVCGPGATDTFCQMGNYYGTADRMVSYLEGIANAVDAGTDASYSPTFVYGREDVMRHCAPHGEVVIMFMGLTGLSEGEEGDAIMSKLNGDRQSLALPEEQLRFLRQTKQQKRKVVAVVTGGSPVDLREVEELADAVVMAWYSGAEGGHALADLLFGACDFTGRLTLTFPESVDALPPFEDYSMAGRTYKYQTRGVAHPFGYGLSYARFEGRVLDGGPAGAGRQTVEVRNVSDRDGVAVVQLYASTPNAGKGQALKSLVAFRRVPVKAGATVRAEFDVPAERLVEYDESGRRLPVSSVTYSVML